MPASSDAFPLLRAIALAAVALLAGSLAGCTGSPGGGGTERRRRAERSPCCFPMSKTARYETFDRPMFEDRIAELGPYQVLYANADQDAAKQQQQAESALAAGADVLVLDPVDSHAAVTIVTAANAEDVPVISYDRLIAGGDLAYYVSFDNEKVGTLQATAFVDALDANGDESAGILMVNGSPTDNNATLFAQGAHERDRPDRSAHPRRVRDAGLEPRQGAGVGGGPDLAVRRRDRRRLRRERRYRERRDRGAPGGERRAAARRHRPGCRALRPSSGS